MTITSYDSGQLFATHVWSFKSDYSFDEALKKCLEMESEQEGRVVSNRGGFQSKAFSVGDIDALKNVENFLEDALRQVESIAATQYSCPIKLRPQKGGMWINVNKKGDFNIAHVHPRAAFSFVCYLQVDDAESKLLFHRPDLSRHYPFDNFSSIFYPQESYCQVASGMGVVFPAWIKHEVCENKSSVPRVSIAFNVEQD